MDAAKQELLVVGLEGEAGVAHHSVAVVAAGAVSWVDAGVGVADRQVAVDFLVDVVADELEEFPVRGHVGGEAPWICENPRACVHGDVEVCLGHPLVHVVGVVAGLRLAERPIPTRSLVGSPVVVVVAVQVHLVHVPSCVGVIAISVEQHHDVDLGALQYLDDLGIAVSPAFDVELCGQECEFGPEVLVAVVPAVDVHLLLGRTIALVLDRPVGDLQHPLLSSIQGRPRTDQADHLRVVILPCLHIEGQSGVAVVPVLLSEVWLLSAGDGSSTSSDNEGDQRQRRSTLHGNRSGRSPFNPSD